MGCAFSKKLKKQAKAEAWIIPSMPALYRGRIQSSGNYHHHLVALTSSTYGLLKIDPSNQVKVPENKKKAGIETFTEMYHKLRSFEVDAEPASKSRMLENVKPDIGSSDATMTKSNLGVEGSDSNIGSCQTTEEPETLNVRDIMEGLEEIGSSHPSPVKAANPILVKGHVPKKSKPFKKSVSFYTVEELDAHVGRSTTRSAAAPARSCKDSSVKDVGRNYSFTANVCSEDIEQNLVGKENAHPSGVASSNLSAHGREGACASRIGNDKRTPFVHPEINTPQSFQVALTEMNRMKKENSENAAGSDVNMSIPGKYSGSGLKSSTNGKTNLSLNVDRENAFTSHISLNLKFAVPESDYAASKGNIAELPEICTEPSSPLFDPDLLASYERALKNLSEDDWNAVCFSGKMKTPSERLFPEGPTGCFSDNIKGDDLGDLKSPLATSPEELHCKKQSLLETYEERCPPGGEKRLVLYTTTLRGIRKTFEDCNNVRGVLQSLGLSIDERDVSMHLDFRSELRELVGPVCVPRVFIKGRYIGGAGEVTQLHENGKLEEILVGLPTEVNGHICDGCGGLRFVPCLDCCGSCKIVSEERKVGRCPNCNENGLIRCPICL